MSKEIELSVPSELRRGGRKGDEDIYVDGGRDLLAYMSDILGLPDLGGQAVLDMGCGTKFTQAILKYDIPIGRYVGIDIYPEMVRFLADSVTDTRFAFHHMNTHNAMYNPGGDALTADTPLPVGDETFDIICLYSVFTHLAPHDYAAMLRVVRPYIKPQGHLVFSLYIDEPSGTGHGLIEEIANELGQPWQPSGEPFRDAFPGKPLQWALYSREHALELIEGTGWRMQRLLLPNALVQHHFVCTPE